jgi:hypothetical protein
MQSPRTAETLVRVSVAMTRIAYAPLRPHDVNTPPINGQVEALPRPDDDGTCLDGFASADDGEGTNLAVGAADLDHFGRSRRLRDSNFHRRRFFTNYRRPGRRMISRHWGRPFRGLIVMLDFHGGLEHAIAGIDLEGGRRCSRLR